MSSALNTRRAVIIIGGISAALFCASALVIRWYSTKRRSSSSHSQRPRKLLSSTNSSGDNSNKTVLLVREGDDNQQKTTADVAVQNAEENDPEIFKADSSTSSGELLVSEAEEKMSAAVSSSGSFSTRDVGRGGRRDYRHHRRSRDEPTKASYDDQDQERTPPPNVFHDPAIVAASSSECVRCSAAEIRGAKLAAEFEAKCQVLSTTPLSPSSSGSGHEETAALCNNPMQHHTAYLHHNQQNEAPEQLSCGKMPCVESPSLSSDMQSEASHDSGKGGSTGLLSSMSPVEEMIEIPAVYEFEVPQDIVGLLIGKHGQTIKWLTEQSQAHIVIRQHFYSDRHKICTLEGTREQINMCLRYIRRKFPPSRFPDLKLTPIIPPPAVTAPHTPVWDNVIQLNLPEGVSCEVVVSSIVDAGHFFVQQPTHPTYPSLARLDQYMMAVYGQSIGVPPLPRPVDAGIICAAPVLGGWYRAQTMELYDEADQVRVKFVDYGGYAKVAVNDLRQIRSDFMTLPFQSTECYLAHVKPDNESGWTGESTAAFEQLSQGKVLEASVLGHARDNVPVVELFVPTEDSTTVSLSRLLASGGHAVWSD